MRLSGRISRNGPSGWDIVLRSPEGKYGRLPVSSELFEVLRQGADLVLSGENEGYICGSDKAFRVTREDAGTRLLAIPLAGCTYYLRENQDTRIQAPVTFSAVLDFQFPEEDVSRSENL